MKLTSVAAGQELLAKAVKNTQAAGKKLEEPSFGEWLKRSIHTVNQMQQEADVAARKLVSGENKDIHGTMIAMQKAGIALDLMLEVRNKIVSAYDEIKRMQF